MQVNLNLIRLYLITVTILQSSQLYYLVLSLLLPLLGLLSLFCVVGDSTVSVHVPTDLGSINVTKSIEKYPTIPRSLQASDTASVALHNTDGSTEVWGTEKPQHLKGEAA